MDYFYYVFSCTSGGSILIAAINCFSKYKRTKISEGTKVKLAEIQAEKELNLARIRKEGHE